MGRFSKPRVRREHLSSFKAAATETYLNGFGLVEEQPRLESSMMAEQAVAECLNRKSGSNVRGMLIRLDLEARKAADSLADQRPYDVGAVSLLGSVELPGGAAL